MSAALSRDYKYRAAKPSDIRPLRELFDKVLEVTYDAAFYERLAKGLETGQFDASHKVAAVVAIDQGHLVGAVVLSTMNVLEARKKPEGAEAPLPFDLLTTQTKDTKAAYVLMLGVMGKYRRAGIGTELLFHGMRALLEDKTVQACFLHSRANDEALAHFYEENSFAKMGLVPAHYTISEKKVDAVVWARAFHDNELVAYQPPAKGQLPNLKDPKLQRARRTPKWVWDCFLQFGLPLLVVFLLFAISYALVLLGPLRGISSKYIKDGYGDDVSHEDELDESDL